jgi:hypothetical protein
MSYPNSIKQFVTKIDKNASGYAIVNEYFNVPSTSPYEAYLDHVPNLTTTVGASGGAAWTEVLVAPTSNSQYLVDYDTGKVTFYSGNASAAVRASYSSLGDDVMAEHINFLQDEVEAVETELGANAKGLYTDIATRLSVITTSISASGIDGRRITDGTVRAGALQDEIKGASWTITKDVLTDISAHVNDGVAAHAATAVSATAPGSTAITTVQGHIEQKGSQTQTPTNPHGMALDDLSGDTMARNFNFTNLYTKFLGVSGVAIAINENGPDASQAIFFYDNSNASGQRFGWNNNSSRFELTTAVEIFGEVTASGSFKPEASGVANVDVGTIGKPFASGNFDTVQAKAFKTGESTGANGAFTTNDGKAVTVKNGLIVSIV